MPALIEITARVEVRCVEHPEAAYSIPVRDEGELVTADRNAREWAEGHLTHHHASHAA